MTSETDYNIITGEPRRKYKSENKTHPHVSSYDVLGMEKVNNYEGTKSKLPKLGKAKDHRKEFMDSQSRLP